MDYILAPSTRARASQEKKSSNLDFDPSFDALFVDRTAVDLGILFFGVGNGDASKERTTNQGMMSCHTNPRSPDET